MKNILQRTLSALVCLAVVLSGVPAWSEATPTPTLEIAEAVPSTPEPTLPAEVPAEPYSTPEAELLPETENTPEAENTPAAEELPEPEHTPEPPAEEESEIQVVTMQQVLAQLGDPGMQADLPAQFNGFAYTIADGAVSILAYSGEDTQIIIPETIEGYPVTSIADAAFLDNIAITGIELPAGLTKIGSWAFSGCSALQSVILPDSAFSIGEYAFSGCSSLESLTLSALATIGEGAFESCPALTLKIHAGSAAHAYCIDHSLTYTLFPYTQPTKIIPENAKISIGYKEQVSIAGWTLEPADAFALVRYSSKAKSIASVSADGLVTGKKARESTTITLKTDNGHSASVKVSVRKAPTSIKLTADRKVIGVDETLQLTTKLSSNSASYNTTYVSSDETIASVDARGLITAHNPGTVSITATTYNGKSTKTPLEITVKAAPEFIALDVDQLTLGKGDSYTLTPTLSEDSATTITYTSSDPSVATVSASGKITAKTASGTAVITAETHNGEIAQCSVTTAAAPSKVLISAARKTIGVGETLQLASTLEPEGSHATIKFKSSKSSVATVNADGLVTAKKAGTATITATTHNNKKKTFKITVKKAPSSISLAADRSVIGVDETLQIAHKLSSGSTSTVTYSVLDASIASIDAGGLLTAHTPGTAVITAETHNGKVPKTPLEIEIKAAPEFITLDADQLILGKGDSYTLTPTLSADSATTVTYTTSDSSVATVNASGKITAKASSGIAVITAETHNGETAQCTVAVTAAPSKVSVTAVRKTIGVGDTLQLTAKLSPEESQSTVKFKSSKTSVATVNADGLVTAKKAGTATITATTHNKKTATIKITVKKAPTSVTAVAERSRLGVGDTMQLVHKLSSSSAATVTYTALNPEFAAVTADGLITAKKAGPAAFIAETHNGILSDPCIVEIVPAPTAILLSREEFLLGVKETASLTAQVNAESAGSITYHSEDPSIATIDAASGKITAKGVGKTRLFATSYVEGLAGYAEIEVKAAPGYVQLPIKKLTLGVKDSYQLLPEIDPDAHTTLSYSTGNSTYATVSDQGLITAKKAGSVTITVKTHNGETAKLSLTVKKAPTSISAVPATLTLGLGESGQMGYKLSSDSASTVQFESLNPEIATIDASGNISTHATGKASIRFTTHNGHTATGTVHVVPAPTSVELTATTQLGEGLKGSASAKLLPEGSASAISYSVVSQNPAAGAAGSIPVIQVDEKGNITALNAGTAVLRVSTYLESVYAERTITVLPAPTFVIFSQDSYTVNTDETLQLNPMIDAGSWATFTYEAKKSGFFTIDENGLLTPIMRGTTMVKVSTHNGLSDTATITVVDPYYPEELFLSETPPQYMESGDTYLPAIGTMPETAVPAIKWSTSDAKIVSVDAITGEITAVSYGQATITGTSSRNPSLKVSYKVTVLDDKLCLTMPRTRTDTSKISSTLAQIRLVRSSAYKELDRLYSKGVITKSDRDKRKGYIERAFDMHLFPWMTETKELYWNASNSENGAKDYKPGIVYYGLPYTQTNRNFNVDKATNKKYFTSTSKNYYLMQGSKFASRAYPGNDCSSYVSMSLHGMNSDYSFMNTRSIASTGIYRTLSDWTDLRPGDLLNKGGSHVVMFLYYANEAKSQMVIIEQGGSTSADRSIDNKAYSNTIACSIKNVTYYTSRNYKIRRPTSLGY